MKTSKIEPILRNNIIVLAKACAKARGIKLASLSRECHGDTAFLDKVVAKSGSFTARKYDEVMAYFDEHWPEGVARPAVKVPFA